jgi:hypothetical protein
LAEKNKNDAAQAIRNLPEDVYPSSKFIERQMSTRGGHRTKLVTFEDAILLVMVLPGRVARETRIKFADIIRRYLGGDKSLIKEVESNAASNSPIAQLARASLAPQGPTMTVIPTEEMLEDRRRKREREEIEIRAMDADIQSKKLCNVKLFADTMSLINPHWADDSRLRLQTEDWLKNIAFNSSGSGNSSGNAHAITNGQSDTSASKSISISQVAQEMGKRLSHGQSIQIGSAVSKRYKDKYGADPPKHSQWVDGAERKVNSYTERDRDIVMDALKEAGII